MSTGPGTCTERETAAERLTLRGRVQGLGVRPALARMAGELHLAGCVRNTARGVEVEIEGTPESLLAFRQRLVRALPVGAKLDQVSFARIEPSNRSSFSIDESSAGFALSAPVPVDRGVCPECLADVARSGNNRHEYSLTTCANCGPRYSMIRAMPYDRSRTGMQQFPLCNACRHEYASLDDRRFHAESIACPRCGPRTWFVDRDGGTIDDPPRTIATAVAELERGQIVALRGVGGYQLLVDATDETAVVRLRRRKDRPGKPLAVLVASCAAAERLAHLDDVERQSLRAPENPIVIARRRHDAGLAPSVCRSFDTVALMLPATPLHWQLATRFGRPLVATSGNRDADPLEYEIATAENHLGDVADCWLHHDRPVVRPIDDSVVRVIAGRPVSLRLARGLAPAVLGIEPTGLPILAVGGHQKAAIALSNGEQAALGPHVGDLDSLAVRQRFQEQTRSLVDLYGAEPELVVHDLHPDYFTTRWAESFGCPTLAVQHHHAHAAAAMLEHDWLDREVLALAWDGTGYGPDGTIWGGECLLATSHGYRRVAHCRRFALPGGEAAIREPWRVAVSLVHQVAGLDAAAKMAFADVPPESVNHAAQVSARKRLSPVTSSMGRLFDGAAALVLGATRASFEGEPAMLLEAVCDPSAPGRYRLPLVDGLCLELDWRPLVIELLADRSAGASPGAMAMRFHRALADAAIAVAQTFPQHAVVLTGGVFQNRVLVELFAEAWPFRADRLGLPGAIPPGDGGLAAGQLAIAAARLRSGGCG